VIESERRALTGDDWFTDEKPYAIEIRGPAAKIQGGSAVFVLPLGPESYTLAATMRQTVAPTLGGIVAEERGILWRQITINGTFGLAPKPGHDTFTLPAPEGPMKGEILSGPGWYLRLERNVLGYYGTLKADGEVAEEVTMIWHDMRRDDHWIVVPEDLNTQRTVQRRFQYPYSLRLKAIADADTLAPDLTTAQDALEFVKQDAQSGRDDIRLGVALIQGAIDYGSQVLAEVRVYATDVDRMIDDLTAVVSAGTSFVDGVSETVSIPRTFLLSTAELVEASLTLMEEALELPIDVRQNYQRALDGLHKMAANAAVFGSTYQSEIGFVNASEAGIAGTTTLALTDAEAGGPPSTLADMEAGGNQSIDLALLNAGIDFGSHAAGSYTGLISETVTDGDTLESIAAELLGDASLWIDLALVNSLSPPYITSTGAPGTLAPGGTIMVPVNDTLAASIANAIGENPVDVFGTNIELKELPSSAVGRPRVGWAIDHSTKKDVKTISGVPNFAQALQMRMWTEKGSIPIAPSFGLRRLVGFGIASADVTYLALAARETLLADSRTLEVQAVRLVVEGDIVDLDADILPVSETEARTMRTALT